MSNKWLNCLTVWYRSRKLKSLGPITGENIDLWVTELRSLSHKTIKIPEDLVMEVRYTRVVDYAKVLYNIASLFELSIDIRPELPQTMLIEDWMVTKQNYALTPNEVLESMANCLQHILDTYNSTEETDFAASTMAQYSHLFITVREFATVCSRHIVG